MSEHLVEVQIGKPFERIEAEPPDLSNFVITPPVKPIKRSDVGSAIDEMGDFSLMVEAVNQYTYTNQQHNKENGFSELGYTQTNDKIQRWAGDLALKAIAKNAITEMEGFSPEAKDEVWQTWISGDDGTQLDPVQFNAFNAINKSAESFENLSVDKEVFTMTQGGPSSPQAGKRNVGAFTLDQRPGKNGAIMEATFLQSEEPLAQNLRTVRLDTDIEKEVDRLEKKRDDAQNRLDKMSETRDGNVLDQIAFSGGMDTTGAAIAGQALADAGQANMLENVIKDTGDTINRYKSHDGLRSYSLDQVDKIIRSSPWVDSFGQEVSFNAWGESVDRGAVRLLKSAAITAEKGKSFVKGMGLSAVSSLLDAAGMDRASQGVDMFNKTQKNKTTDELLLLNDATEEWIDNNLPGMERLRLRDTTFGNVISGATEEIFPFAVALATTGGSSFATKQLTSAAMGRTVAVLERAGKLKYIDRFVAPFLGATTSATRDGVDGWIGAQKAGDAILNNAGFDSVQEAMDAGNTKVAGEAQKIFDDSNKVFFFNIGSTATLEMVVMARYLGLAGKAGKKAVAQQTDLLKRTMGDKFSEFAKDMGEAGASAATEAGTEVMQGILSRNWAQRYYDANTRLFDTKAMTEEAWIGAIMGGVTSATISRMGRAKVNAALSKKARQKKSLKSLQRNARNLNQKIVQEALISQEIASIQEQRGGNIGTVERTDELNGIVLGFAGDMVDMRNADIAEQAALQRNEVDADQQSLIDELSNETQTVEAGVTPEGGAPIETVQVDTKVTTGDKVDNPDAPSTKTEPIAETTLSKGVEKIADGEFQAQSLAEPDDSFSFDSAEQANDFMEKQSAQEETNLKRREGTSKDGDKTLTQTQVDRISGQVVEDAIAADEAAADEEAAKRARGPAKMKAKKSLTKKEKAELQEKEDIAQAKAEKKLVRERANTVVEGLTEVEESLNPKKPFLEGSVHGNLTYLASLMNGDGTVALDNALGHKADQLVDWMTRNGRDEPSSADAQKRMTKALQQLARTGTLPKTLKGMESEFGDMRRLMEPVYRSLAAKAGLDLKSEEAKPFNEIYLDDMLRNSVDELKSGEEPAKRKQFIRVANKDGTPQAGHHGLDAQSQAESVRGKKADPEGQRMQIEEDDGRFYIIRPVITPGVNASLRLVEGQQRGVVSIDKNQLVPRFIPYKDTLVAANVNFDMKMLGISKMIGKLPWVKETWFRGEALLTQAKGALLIDFSIGTNLAGVATSQIPAMPFDIYPADHAEFPNQMKGVTARNGKDSLNQNDVAESVARGENKYTFSNEANRQWIIQLRQRIMDTVKMLKEAGALEEFIALDEGGAIDWEGFGIPGWFPRRVNDDATSFIQNQTAKLSGTVPKAKEAFEKRRTQDLAQTHVDNGIRYDDLIDSFYQFSREAYHKVAGMRFSENEAVKDIEVTDPDQVKSLSGKGLTQLIGNKVLKFPTIRAANSFRNSIQYNMEDDVVSGITELLNINKGLLVGFDTSVWSIFGQQLFADSPKAFRDAFITSAKAFAEDPVALYNDFVSKTEVAGAAQQAAEFGVIARPNIGALEGMRGTTLAFMSAGFTRKAADSMDLFIKLGALGSWIAHTDKYTKDGTGRVVGGATNKELGEIARHSNSIVGMFDPKRIGIPSSATAIGRATLFSYTMYMGFGSLLVGAAKGTLNPFTSDLKSKKARNALGKYMAVAYGTYIPMAFLAGLDWEEIKERTNPLKPRKFFSLPITFANGRTIEVGIGNFVLSTIKTMGSVAEAVSNKVESIVTGVPTESDKEVVKPLTSYISNRTVPGLSLAKGFLTSTDFLGRPINRWEALNNGIVPLVAQDLTKRGFNRMWTALAKSGSMWSEFAASQRTYIDSNTTNPQLFGEAALRWFGGNVYSASEKQNYDIHLKRASRKMFGKNFETELTEGEAIEVQNSVNELPVFKKIRERAFQSESALTNKLKGNAEFSVKSTNRILGWMREINQDGQPGRANSKNRVDYERFSVVTPSAPNVVDERGESMILTNEMKFKFEKMTGVGINAVMNELNADPAWVNGTFKAKRQKLQERVSEVGRLVADRVLDRTQ